MSQVISDRRCETKRQVSVNEALSKKYCVDLRAPENEIMSKAHLATKYVFARPLASAFAPMPRCSYVVCT